MIASILIVSSFRIRFESALGKRTQFEDSVSFRIPGEAKYGQSPGKCLLKLLPILQLNSESPFPASFAGLPLVDGGRNQNPFLDNVLRLPGGRQERPPLWGNPAPTRPKAVGRQPTLQSR